MTMTEITPGMIADAPQPVPATPFENDAIWARFYRDGKTLGDICEEFSLGVYDLSPWLTRPLALAAAQPAPQPVAAIVPEHCSASAFVFEGGCLTVSKDGSGYIVVDEGDFQLEDDRCEGPDGPEGSVHWIVRFPAGEMTAIRDFLNGQDFTATPAEIDRLKAENERLAKDMAYAKAAFETAVVGFQTRIAELEAENKRMREALEFYAVVDDYKAPFTGGMGKLWSDCGAVARAALAKEGEA